MKFNAESSPVLVPRLPAWRGRLVLLGLLGAFVGLAARAAWLQGVNADFLRQEGEARYGRTIEVSATRGVISDRQGRPLAVSTPVESVWASPPEVEASPAQLRQLAAILGMERGEIAERLAQTGREFVYIKRRVPPEVAERALALGIKGLFRKTEYRRYYPGGEAMAHLIGITDTDDRGQEGLELAQEDLLAGKPGLRRVIKDRHGRIVEDVALLRAPQNGRDLVLSVDASIQSLAHGALRQAVEAHRAKAGGVVVLDARSGEVLALANLPSYNPNNRSRVNPAHTRNRAVTDVFEPGSTLKPFSVAAALEASLVRPDTAIDTAPGRLAIGGAIIRDAHPHGRMSVAEIIQKSSNVGAARIALDLPAQELWRRLQASGFGAAPGAGFPGEVGGRLRPWKSWRPIEQATIAYGHGISVTLLQLARAYTVFATDGVLLPVSLLKLDHRPEGVRAFSPGTAAAVRRMLETVVQPGGTAPAARVPGYRVAGKTGTAHKLEGGGYAADRYVSSFVGLAPVSDPRIVVAVMIDEPTKGDYYGGVVAGPVFSQVAAGTLRLLGVPPDDPDPGTYVAPDPHQAVPEEV